MKKIIKIISLFSLLMLTINSYAVPAWYYGQVKRVAFIGSDGSFIVTFKSSALNDCKYKYAYFVGDRIGEGRMKGAYTMALTSITSGIQMGVVIDKSINGPDGLCYAMGMTSDLRAN